MNTIPAIRTLASTLETLIEGKETFDVSRFRAQALSAAGVARQSLFLVNIYLPQGLFSAESSKTLSLFCSQTFLPGISVASADGIRRYGVGASPRMPYGVFFGDLQCMFMVDGRGKVPEVFHRWLKSIVNFDDSHGMSSVGEGGASPFEVGYKDDYAARIEVSVFDDTAQEFLKYTMEECYPAALGDVQMDWGDTDSIAMLPITFNYRTWKSSKVDTSSETSEFFSVFKDIVSGNGQGRFDSMIKDTLDVVTNSFSF